MDRSQTIRDKGDILIVDDNLDSLNMLAALLEEKGYEMRGATGGEAALRVVRYEPPDLVLLDVRMPGMSGYEVCLELKKDLATRDIPVIFLSALDETVDKVRGFEVGGVDYITKPTNQAEVLTRVQTHLALGGLREQLETRNAELQAEIVERQMAQETLQRLTHQLCERVKELNCLYGISSLVEREDSSLEEILQGTVDLIPSSWQYPQITCARLFLDQQEYQTVTFRIPCGSSQAKFASTGSSPAS